MLARTADAIEDDVKRRRYGFFDLKFWKRATRRLRRRRERLEWEESLRSDDENEQER